MKEKAVEEYLREQVKAAGGKAYKFVSPGNVGVPDRLVLFPGGRVVFVELKALGKKPTELQCAQHERIKRFGFAVHVASTKEMVDWIVMRYAKGAIPNEKYKTRS